MATTTFICIECKAKFAPGTGYARRDYRKPGRLSGTMILFCDKHAATPAAAAKIAANEEAYQKNLARYYATGSAEDQAKIL